MLQSPGCARIETEEQNSQSQDDQGRSNHYLQTIPLKVGSPQPKGRIFYYLVRGSPTRQKVNLFGYGRLRTRFSGLLIVFGRTPLILVCLVHAFLDQFQPDVDILIRGRSVDLMAGGDRTLAPTG